MVPNTPELLRNWVATGYDETAVAGYGTSVEFLERALITDQIPCGKSSSDHDLLPYQKQILAKGGYLYFAHPFTKNIKLYKPSLVEELYKLTYLPDHNSMQQTLRDYAQRNAITHHFESLTGSMLPDDEHIVTLVYFLFPALAKQHSKNETLMYKFASMRDQSEWTDPPLFGLEDSKLSLPQLKDALAESISRRGIIIYYNEKVLQNNVLGGVELETELLIHSRKPLTPDVISGIEPLSEADRKAVENLM